MVAARAVSHDLFSSHDFDYATNSTNTTQRELQRRELRHKRLCAKQDPMDSQADSSFTTPIILGTLETGHSAVSKRD